MYENLRLDLIESFNRIRVDRIKFLVIQGRDCKLKSSKCVDFGGLLESFEGEWQVRLGV